MGILAWTFTPIAVTVLAVVVVYLRGRPRGPVEAIDSVEQYARFCAAIARPVPGGRTTPSNDHGAADG